MSRDKVCPRCGVVVPAELIRTMATSREDNKTMVCNDCGTREALWDWLAHLSRSEP